ncbi:spermine oxidase-like [Armigeres subalbatus]|uniref:spermine oxidase-like n=1 Tax=Armigeres subalbatus TaxID=124917 RepID=UPI002ED388FB
MNPRIVIIGAGAAGIASATRLIEKGYTNLTILEAENRIGGRIHTIPFGSNVVDLGAQWCHGEVSNACYELGSKLNVFGSNNFKYEDFELVKSSGEKVPQEYSQKLMSAMWSILESHRNELSRYRGSLGSFVLEKFRTILNTSDYVDISNETAFQFLEFFHKFENSIEASDCWFDTSGAGYLQYWECDGDHLLNWKDRGYKTILDILMKRFPSPNSIDAINIEDYTQFNKTVANICWNSNPDNIASVRCTDNSVYDADHVICTVSLGVLKERYQSLFTPELPAIKQNAIKGLSIGTVDKLYLEFDKPFWSDGWQGLSLLWNQNDLEEIRASENSWMEDVFGFYTVDFQPNILCGWISGVNARRMERTSDEEVRKGCVFLLRKFMKHIDIPEPVTFRRTQWYSNPNFRGSYSFRSVTTDLLNTSAEHLALPLSNAIGIPVVQFAGEATHDHYYSTVHGAIETGWREANRLIGLYQSPLQCQVDSDVNVLILGAGIAGLGAAKRLIDTEKNFLLLEAQSEAGGRIKTIEMHHFGGLDEEYKQLVDSGAQWLHGKQNELYKIAESYDLLHEELSEEGLGEYIRNDGLKIDSFLVKKVDFLIGQILEDCEKFAQKENDSFPSSVEVFLREEFKKRLDPNLTTDEIKLANQLLEWHMRFQVIDNSCLTMSDVSAKLWGSYSFNGESCQAHINMKYGFQALVNCLVDEVGSNRILYKKEVTEIRWKDVDSRVLVRCSDGTCYSCQHLVVTFSLGVLKATPNLLFQPALPKSFRRSIRNIGFGTINKIFLQFESAWWDDAEGFQLIWEDNLEKGAHWTRFLSGFDIVSPGPANTLLGWIGSYGALEMERLSDAQIVNDCVFLLEKFTRKKVPQPVRYYCTRWNSNPFIRGSYSYTSVNCDYEPTFLKVLQEPIVCNQYDRLTGEIERNPEQDMLQTQKPSASSSATIRFAGEACHEKYFSTAHGAFLSGMEQAGKLV